MKNISKLMIALIGILTMASCSPDDVQDRPVIQGITAPILTAPTDGSAYVLTHANMSQQAERFVWTSANYGGPVAISYTIQIDKDGGDFSAPQVVGGANSANQASITQEALNTACMALPGVSPQVSANFIVRVMSSASGYAPMYSNVVTIAVTPYTTEIPKLWVPGSYQAASGYGNNWTPSSAPKLAAIAYGDAHFEGYVYLHDAVVAPNDGFKFTTQPDWNGTNYGDDGSFSGVISATGGNIGANSGYYRINVNTNTTSSPNSYTLTPTTWGVIGDATPNGWNSSTPLVYDQTTKLWTATVALIGGKSIKFRANDAWTINLGKYNAASDTTPDMAGPNMTYNAPSNLDGPVASGNYLVTLDLSNPRNYSYSFTLIP